MAVQTFQKKWAERNPTTPDPEKLQNCWKKSARVSSAPWLPSGYEPQIMSLAVPVEFPTRRPLTGAESGDHCRAVA